MLKTVRLTNCIEEGCALILGGFDGVHLGHRRLIERAKKAGKSVGITLILGCKGEYLFTLQERLQILSTLGVDFAVVMDFDKIKDLSAKSFLESLEKEYVPSLYVCGDDFRFGKNAQGTPDTIKSESEVPVEVETLLQVNGEKVATRTLKNLLQEGKVEEVEKLLGFCYFALGEVVKGRQVGRQMGFPTANIAYTKEKMPIKEGVYAIRAEVAGKTYKGIANFGTQPTFEEKDVRLEVYVDGFDGDLYGKTLKVEFVSFLRPVQKFENQQALTKQLEEDVKKVREND